MQAIPVRLSQTIRTAFHAARPLRRDPCHPQFQALRCSPCRSPAIRIQSPRTQPAIRCYSSDKRSDEVEKEVHDAKHRIAESLDSRAEAATDAESKLKSSNDETIVHAKPEASSIVHSKDGTPAGENQPHFTSAASSSDRQPPLPSQKADLRSQITNRFSQFMDTFQSNVFVASQRLNELTGYTGIERLKREIDNQESAVQTARQLVKTNRARYAEAISMRSTTQREVNDLLHRKHAWSPQDLERFTNLYRSDHANEQSEQKAHQELSEAEVKYEEASTRLAKSILARYHEEQIWSDKIRQMSTWGTWGLMGLNVLLFVILQLAIEPWRRRRLVRGFEEKVEVALAAREEENRELRMQLQNRAGHEVVSDAVAKKPEPLVAAAGEQLAEAIVDAITGSTDEGQAQAQAQATKSTTDTNILSIESAAEKAIVKELNHEAEVSKTLQQMTEILDEVGSPDIIMPTPPDTLPTPETNKPWSNLPSSLYTSTSNLVEKQYNTILNQFDTSDHVVLSKRELTTKVIEGVAVGFALAGGVAFVVLRNR